MVYKDFGGKSEEDFERPDHWNQATVSLLENSVEESLTLLA